MNQKAFNIIWSDALDASDRAAFVSNWALSSIWEDAPEDDALPDHAEQCGRIWDLSRMTIADIRRTTGLSQAGFAERFCIPRHTVINWEQRGGCAPYIRLMLARLCGLTEGLLL